MVEGPLRDAGGTGVGLGGSAGQQLQPVVAVGHPQRRPRAELGIDEARGDLRDLFGQQDAAQVAAHRVQALDAPLAFGGRAGLRLQPGGELADQQPDHQHHGEGERGTALVG